jgi:hypothetical protein
LFALDNKLADNSSLGFKLAKRLLLSLNQLLDIFNAARSNISGGAKHDAIQEFNVRFELITIGVAFPVQINLDLGLEDSRDELFVLLDEGVKLLTLFSPLLFASFCHQDFQDLFQPFLDLTPLKIFAKGLEQKRTN